MKIIKDWWAQILLAIIIVIIGVMLIIRIQYDTGKTIVAQDIYTISTVHQNDNSIIVSLRNGNKFVLDNEAYKISYKSNSDTNKLIKYTNKIGNFNLDDTYEIVVNYPPPKGSGLLLNGSPD